MWLDGATKHTPHGLRNVLRQLVDEALTTKRKVTLSIKDLIERLQLPPNTVATMFDIWSRKTAVPVVAGAVADCYEVRSIVHEERDGISYEASTELQRVVTELREPSAAFSAGLRKGDLVDLDRTDGGLRTVRVAKPRERTLKWRPSLEKVPALVLRSGLTREACADH